MIYGDYVKDLRDNLETYKISRCKDFQKYTYNIIKKHYIIKEKT